MTPASLAVTANDASRIYGSDDPPFSASFSGFVNGDTVSVVSGTTDLSTIATAGSAVGSYQIIPTLGTLNASNYDFGPFLKGTLTVNPAALTIIADNQGKVYGAPLPNLTATYRGFVNGDTAASLTTQATFSTGATTGSTVGNYPITVAGATGSNYTIGFLNGSLMVTPAPVSISGNNLAIVYGTALPVLTASYSGFVNGDTVSNLLTPAVLITTATPISPVGTYPILVSGATSPNYSITFLQGLLTIFIRGTTTIQSVGGNLFQLKSMGLPGQTFTVQYTTNLGAPWMTLGHSTGDVSGTFIFDASVLAPFTLYRLTYP